MKNFLHKLILILFCFSILSVSACSQASDPIVKDTQGKTFKLSQLHGKWIIVNFWAGWCDACREEIPDLNKFNEKIKN